MDARGHVALYTALGIFLIGFVKAEYGNVTEDGSLWSSLVRNCKRPTLSCIQENFYKYVDDGIESPDDIEFGGFMRLTRNSLLFDNTINNTIEDKLSGRSEDGPLGDMAKTLRNKMVKFMLSHDVQLQLPQTFFDGAIFQISPKSLGENGALVNLDILPNQISNPNGEGRIFFKKLSKFRNLHNKSGGNRHVLPYFLARLEHLWFMKEETELNNSKKENKRKLVYVNRTFYTMFVCLHEN